MIDFKFIYITCNVTSYFSITPFGYFGALHDKIILVSDLFMTLRFNTLDGTIGMDKLY